MKEFSYGIIPLQQRQGHWYLFLVQHRAGHWSFPKGHAEEGETPHQTAERELQEETALQIVRFLPIAPISEQYQNGPALKTVTYYLAEVSGSPTIDTKELQDGRWLPLEQAEALITYPEAKAVARKAFVELRSTPHPL